MPSHEEAEYRWVRQCPLISGSDVVGKSVKAATDTLQSCGLVAVSSGDGVVTSQDFAVGSRVEAGSRVKLATSAEHPDPHTSTEFQVKVSTIATIDNVGVRDALRLLVTQVANAIDTGASHIQLSVEIAVGREAKDSLEQAARDANAAVTTTDL